MTVAEILDEIAQLAAALASLTSPNNTATVLREIADEYSGMQGAVQ